ncbi:MAG: hypothetical protein U0Y68_23600 [Blastocatellia bacterium]
MITGKGGHGAEGLAKPRRALEPKQIAHSGPDDWREAVREQFDRGAGCHQIRQPFPGRDEVKAAVEPRWGCASACTVRKRFLAWAVRRGVDCIEHPLRTEEIIQLMAQRGNCSPLSVRLFIFERKAAFSARLRASLSRSGNLELVRKKDAGAGIKIGVALLNCSTLTVCCCLILISWSQKLFVSKATASGNAGGRDQTEARLRIGDKLGTWNQTGWRRCVVIDGKPISSWTILPKLIIMSTDGVDCKSLPVASSFRVRAEKTAHQKPTEVK